MWGEYPRRRWEAQIWLRFEITKYLGILKAFIKTELFNKVYFIIMRNERSMKPIPFVFERRLGLNEWKNIWELLNRWLKLIYLIKPLVFYDQMCRNSNRSCVKQCWRVAQWIFTTERTRARSFLETSVRIYFTFNELLRTCKSSARLQQQSLRRRVKYAAHGHLL